MTQAISEFQKLSEAEQDRLAEWILAELESERRWPTRRMCSANSPMRHLKSFMPGGRFHLTQLNFEITHHRALSTVAFEFFQEDPNRPGLQFKRVHSTCPIYSARISGDHCVR